MKRLGIEDRRRFNQQAAASEGDPALGWRTAERLSFSLNACTRC